MPQLAKPEGIPSKFQVAEIVCTLQIKFVAILEEFDMAQRLPPIHPGEILLEEFLEPMGISQYRLAKDISVPPRRINEIVLGKRAITPDTALRLSRYFGLSERFWMNLQTRYDIEVEKDRLQNRLDREVQVHASMQ
jgi:addiction module HigA family antidote